MRSNTSPYQLVANVPARLLPAGKKTRKISVYNDSASDIYISELQNVTTSGNNIGILIRANGGSLDDEPWPEELWAISAGSVSIVVSVRYEEEPLKAVAA